VLHAFQKKSQTGIKTPTSDLELIARRLKVAEADQRSRALRWQRTAGT
jgi:phage-related protein